MKKITIIEETRKVCASCGEEKLLNDIVRARIYYEPRKKNLCTDCFLKLKKEIRLFL